MFRIFLHSNDPTTKSDDTKSKFAVHLSESYDEMTNYECALEQIIVPNQMFNIRHGRGGVLMKMAIFQGDGYKFVHHSGDVPPGFYSSVSKVVAEVKKIIDEGLQPYREQYPVEQYPLHEVISMTQDDTRVLVKISTPLDHIHFFHDVALALGFPPSSREGQSYVENTALGLKIGIPRTVESIFVYSDVIMEQCVANVSSPLLRIVHVDRSSDTSTHHSYTNLQFVPVRASFFNSIEVELRDGGGDLIMFNPDAGIVTLVLLFKAIKGR